MVGGPFAGLSKTGNHYIQIPPGEYEVIVTLADVSPEQDGSQLREAYASLLFVDTAAEVTRQFIELAVDGNPSGEVLEPGEFWGYGVVAGTSCFL